MEIRASAHKHGIADADMLHAIRQALRVIDGTNDVTVYIGADASGRLLEVGLVDAETDTPRIVHAMPLRASWYEYLR